MIHSVVWWVQGLKIPVVAKGMLGGDNHPPIRLAHYFPTWLTIEGEEEGEEKRKFDEEMKQKQAKAGNEKEEEREKYAERREGEQENEEVSSQDPEVFRL